MASTRDPRDEAIDMLTEALEYYADPVNWDGAGGWTNPRYSAEAAEMTLEALAEVLPKKFGKYAAKKPAQLLRVK